MKIAVVGSQGLLGNSLVRVWQEADEEIVPLDLPDCDITARLFTLDLFRGMRPDVIVNASGIMKIDWLEKRSNTARTVHIQGTANLREAAKRSDALLVQFSCAEVFGETAAKNVEPLTENDVPEPTSVFAQTKLDGERAASEYERHLIIRTSTLFGQTGPHTAGNMVESILRALRRSEPLKVISDIQTSPTWSDDLAKATLFLIKTQKNGLFHIAGSTKATPYEISHEILKQTGLKRDFLPVSSAEFEFFAPRAVHTMLNSDHYSSLNGTPLLGPWQESLAMYLEQRSQSQK